MFGCQLPDDEYDSVGGWMGGQLGRIPRRGDTAEFDGLRLEVARGDARRAIWLRVKRNDPTQTARPADDE
ncbi:Magnesium and cobalt efflux protein CorC [compost metagenome]